jgi:hypothetical protein
MESPSALCKITTLFENPEKKKLSEQQIHDAIYRGEERPLTAYDRDRTYWPEIQKAMAQHTWMSVSDFDAEPPKDHPESVGFIAFWESGMTPQTQTIEAGPTQADAKSGHRVRFSLSIRDSSGKVLWEKHSGWHFVGETYTVTGTTVISGQTHTSTPNETKILDGLAKQLSKEAGCQR